MSEACYVARVMEEPGGRFRGVVVGAVSQRVYEVGNFSTADFDKAKADAEQMLERMPIDGYRGRIARLQEGVR